MTEQQTNVNPDSQKESSRRGLTVARKVSLVAALVITVCFMAMITLSVLNERKALMDQGEHSFTAITSLLANNVAGGLQWNKAASVEKAYMDFAQAEGSAISDIMTFNRIGDEVTRFTSETHTSFDLSVVPEWLSAQEESGGLYVKSLDHHIVIVATPLSKKGRAGRPPCCRLEPGRSGLIRFFPPLPNKLSVR